METVGTAILEYGVARFARPGQNKSGDRHVIRYNQRGALIAAIDGIGHGEEAAIAAEAVASILTDSANEAIIALVEFCHERLRLMRGVVLSVASIETATGMMTWLGVGNVQGMLLRAGAHERRVHEGLLLRAGVVGVQLPPLQAAVLPVARGDTLVFATDGLGCEFVETLSVLENPQRAADRILERYRTGSDDALVLVVRLMGVSG